MGLIALCPHGGQTEDIRLQIQHVYQCVYTSEVLPFTLCPLGQHIWGFACSRSRVHNSHSASPSDCLQLHTEHTAVCHLGPLEPQKTSPSPQNLLTMIVLSPDSYILQIIKASIFTSLLKIEIERINTWNYAITRDFVTLWTSGRKTNKYESQNVSISQ